MLAVSVQFNYRPAIGAPCMARSSPLNLVISLPHSHITVAIVTIEVSLRMRDHRVGQALAVQPCGPPLPYLQGTALSCCIMRASHALSGSIHDHQMCHCHDFAQG